jgi:capsular polysaccharide biosynthesis protein
MSTSGPSCIDWKNRNQAADWANELVRRINAEMRTRAIAKADASIVYLQTELARTVDVGTRDAVNKLIASEIYRRMVATVTQEYAFEVVDRAMVPDEHDPLRPKLAVMLLVGVALGLIVGCIAALVAAELK